MAKYRVDYRLYGSVEVEANSPEDAEDIVNGIIMEDSEFITDKDLYEGVYKAGVLGDPSFNIDGDAIEVLQSEEVGEDA